MSLFFENLQPPEYRNSDRNIIEVYNPGTTVFAAGTAVSLAKYFGAINGSSGIFHGQITTAADNCWGIAAENILPHTSGTVVLNGICQAFITGSGDYAAPGANGKLVAGSSGKALILHPGDAKTPGIVQLGYSGNQEKEYNGSFKLRHVEGRTFELYNGRYPTNSIAGETDLPGAEKVARQNIAVPEGKDDVTLLLRACCRDGVYSVEFGVDNYITGGADGCFDIVRLADLHVSSGKVEQYYKDNNVIYFGRQWYL